MSSRAAVLIIVFAGALSYVSHLSNPLVLDDEGNIVENESIRDLWSPGVFRPARELSQAGRPIVNLTFALNYAAGGLDVAGYRLVNLGIHLICAILLFAVTRRLLTAAAGDTPLIRGPTLFAFAMALLWTVHPLNSEAVSYLTQRTESLMAAFYLLTVYAAVRSLEQGRQARWWLVLSIASCALGMGSKESMVTAPVMVVLVDRVFFFGSFSEAFRERRYLYAGLASTWLILAVLTSTGPRSATVGFSVGVSSWTYLLNQAPLIVRYLRLSVWPASLVANYGAPAALTLADVLPAFIVVGALVGLTVAAFRWRPRLAFLGAWIFIILAPASSVVPIATEVGAERRMYLPLAAVIALTVLLAAWIGNALRARFPSLRQLPVAAVVGVPLAVVSLSLAGLTVLRNREYASPLTLAQVTLDRYPTPSTRHVLAELLLGAGRRDEALAHLRAAVAGAPRAHYSLGRELFRGGQIDEAIPHLQAFVTAYPRLVWTTDAYGLLGQAYAAQGNWSAAIDAFQQVLARSPDSAAAERGLADVLVSAGRHEEAIGHFRRAFRSGVPDVDALNQFGLAYAYTGQLAEGLEAFRQAVTLDPRHAASRINLALALCKRGEIAEAAVHAHVAATLQPDNPDALALFNHLLAAQSALGATTAREVC